MSSSPSSVRHRIGLIAAGIALVLGSAAPSARADIVGTSVGGARALRPPVVCNVGYGVGTAMSSGGSAWYRISFTGYMSCNDDEVAIEGQAVLRRGSRIVATAPKTTGMGFQVSRSRSGLLRAGEYTTEYVVDLVAPPEVVWRGNSPSCGPYGSNVLSCVFRTVDAVPLER